MLRHDALDVAKLELFDDALPCARQGKIERSTRFLGLGAISMLVTVALALPR